MSITDDQVEYLEKLLEACAAQPDKLNKWEAGFVDDQRARWEQYGQGIFISPKQWAILNKIGEKVGS